MNKIKIIRKNTEVFRLKICGHGYSDGDSIHFTVKKAPDNDETDSDALIDNEWTYGTDFKADDDGVAELVLEESDTNGLPGGYAYDFKYLNADKSDARTLVIGEIEIVNPVTLEV